MTSSRYRCTSKGWELSSYYGDMGHLVGHFPRTFQNLENLCCAAWYFQFCEESSLSVPCRFSTLRNCHYQTESEGRVPWLPGRAFSLIDIAPSTNSLDDIDIYKSPHYPRPIKVNMKVLSFIVAFTRKAMFRDLQTPYVMNSEASPPRHRIFMFALCIISGLEKAIFLCCKHVYDSMWSSVAECLCWSNKYSLRVYRNDMLKCDNMRTRLTQIVQFFPLSHQHSIDNGAELSAREKFPFRWNLNWIPSRKNTQWVNMSLTDYESSSSLLLRFQQRRLSSGLSHERIAFRA